MSERFPVFVSLNSSSKIYKENQKTTIHERVMHDTKLTAFKKDLHNVNWNSINHSPEANSKYEPFFKIFSELYEKHFPLKDFQIKVKDLQAPWISKGLKKSSKQKQKLYIKFLKNKSTQNEQIYKNYKHLFEKLRKKAKQTYYQSILKDCQNDMRRTWQIMKEITGKCKVNSNRFPKSINVNGKSIKKNSRIAEEFNKYFTNVGPNLASKIQNTSKTFEDFLFPVQKNMECKGLTFEVFEKVFKSVKHNKTAGHDDIVSNIIIKVHDEISYPSFMIFHSSFNENIFPEQLKVSKVSPIFKVGKYQFCPYTPKY